MQRKRAFTLIELLVVIAIIAILAAILFPVFAKARERAKQSRSLNNMKQLAIGVITYSQDYGESFPGWVENTPGKFAHNVWDEQINPFLKSKDVYNNGDTGIKSWSDPLKQRVLTYGINSLLIITPATWSGSTAQFMKQAENGGANAPSVLSPSVVSDPANTILFAELATEAVVQNPNATTFTTATQPYTGVTNATPGSAWSSALVEWIDIDPRYWVENSKTNTNSYSESTGWDSTSGVARDLYGGGGNYAFIDGHVKFLKIGETVGLGQNVTGIGVIQPGNTAWNINNIYNMWNPTR